MENVGLVDLRKKELEQIGIDASSWHLEPVQHHQRRTKAPAPAQHSIGERPLHIRSGNETKKSIVDEDVVCRTHIADRMKYEAAYY